MKVKSMLLMLLVMAVIVGLSLPVFSAEKGGILTGHTSRHPAVLGYTPKITGMAVGSVLPCLEFILSCDANGNPKPLLAESWKEDPNGKYIDLTIRKGVKFHDGTDLNGEAIKYNLDKRLEFSPGEFTGLKSVDLIDEYTVRLNTEFISISLYGDLRGPGALIGSPTHLKKGEEVCMFHPVGTGPFKFKDFKRDAYMKFEKFDDYWEKGLPHLDGIEQVVIPDTMTTMAEFLKGNISFYGPRPKEAKDLMAKGYKTSSMPGGLHGLGCDTVNPDSIYSDIRVRHAIEHAIDKKAICDTLGYGFMEPLNQYCNRDYPGYNPNITGRNYDPEKAKQLLAAAGYPNGFKTVIHADHRVDRDWMTAIQSYLDDVGIKVQVNFDDAGKYMSYRQRGWKNSLIYIRHGGWEPLTAHQIARLYGEGVLDYVSIKRTDEFKKALKAALMEMDTAKRAKLTQNIMQISYDEAMWVPLWATDSVLAFQSNVRDTGHFEVHPAIWFPRKAWLDR